MKLFNNEFDLNDENIVKYIYYNGVKTNYMVSKYGDVLSIRKENIKYLKPYPDKDGYNHVIIRVDNIPRYVSVHRLVAFAFLENDDPKHKNQVNHKDGNHKNNCVENLEWCTCLENIHHAWSNNLCESKKCENHPNSVYSNKQIKKVCKMLSKGKYTMKEISEKTKVSYTVVKQIKNRVIWRDISKDFDFSNFKSSRNTK